MTPIDFKLLIDKIDLLTVVMAAQVGPEMTLTERAPLLSQLGLDRTQIARVCGTTPKVVSVRLAEAKRKGRATTRRSVSAQNERDD